MAYRLIGEYPIQLQLPSLNQIFMLCAILSLAVGNITAIVQSDVKRLLAYSTIAHIGFIFLGLLAAPKVGYAPALYYMIVYIFVEIAAFGVLLFLSSKTVDVQNLEDLKGLAKRYPWIAFIMLLVAFSLAGVPPTVGFYAKFMILNALINAGFTWLAALAVVFSIIGAFYYLKLVRVMYFEESSSLLSPVVGKYDFKIALSLNGLGILLLGVLPAPLFTWCQIVFLKP
jgi:NADH-quinone oxidoreductase subunit N